MSFRRTRVYVAGPISIGHQPSNVRKAMDAAETLFNAGYAPFLPHLSYWWQLEYSHTHEEWMALDHAFVMCSDVMLRLPGESRGSDQEEEWAGKLGKKVFYCVKDLIKDTPATMWEGIDDDLEDLGRRVDGVSPFLRYGNDSL